MDLCSIASGSSGNCIYIGDSNTKILVDVGISKTRIVKGLEDIKVSPESLDAILITHEHSDHISGLGVMSRKYHIPIYSTVETINAALHVSTMGRMDASLFRYIEPNQAFQINDFTVHPFSVSHDAANPLGYSVVSSDGHRASIATDMGMYNDYIISQLADSEILLIEANHDVHMLEAGTYPYHLKRRILGDKGHLSNENSGKLLCELWTEKLQHIFLGHLSKENNYPDLAYETVKVELNKTHKSFSSTTNLLVAKREEPSVMVSV